VRKYFVGTDGASGHFKSKFTLFSMFKVFKGVSWMWEFCAPGHGKGPWDGLAAIIKTMLRRLEKHGAEYMRVAADVFHVLFDHYAGWAKDAAAGTSAIDAFRSWYIAGPNDESVPPGAYVLPSITRPAAASRDGVTDITGIRSRYFCFRSGSTLCLLWCRAFSCHCDECLAEEWDKCKNDDAGKWIPLTMKITKAAVGLGGSSRTSKNSICDTRRSAARKALVGQFVALQSADDPDNSWWLACVTKKAFRSTRTENKGGFQLVKNSFYLKVQHYDNDPGGDEDGDEDMSWKKSREPPTLINAEGLIFIFGATDFVFPRRGKATCAAANTNTSRVARFEVKRLAEEYAAAWLI
jgi:hypothetical protein